MPKFETTRIVPHTPEQMFALVADVERYPEFLPLCEALTVRSRKEREGKVLVIADMTAGYKTFHETFGTQVLLDPKANIIDVQYIDGPFKYLNSRWTFTEDPDGGCKIHFSIDYEFKSRILGMMVGSMFDKAFNRFAQAFEKRAGKVYRA